MLHDALPLLCMFLPILADAGAGFQGKKSLQRNFPRGIQYVPFFQKKHVTGFVFTLHIFPKPAIMKLKVW
jgi:hypothetical protein